MRFPRLLFVLLLAIFSQARLPAASPLWNFSTPEAILASPAVAADGTIYIASYDRVVYALNPNGSIKWTNNLPEPTYIYFNSYTAVYGTPAVGGDGTIYVPCENGKLLALNPTNGVVNWTYATTNVDANLQGLYSSVALGPDGTIYFGSYDRNLYAINPDGTRKWASLLTSTIFASPVVGRDGTIYCGSDNGKLFALHPDTGVTNWVFTTGNSAIVASPALGTNGTIYIGVNATANPRFFSFNTNGTTNWVFTAGGRIGSSAALGGDGTIYFGSDDHKLYALNPDGTKKWDFTAGAAVKSSPAVAADGTIYFGCDNGNLYALDANGNPVGTLFVSSNHISASPAIGPDGTIYFASEKGTLYVARGCRPPVASDWPMFRRELGRSGRAAGELTNHPPVLPPIGDQAGEPYTALVITNTASDLESPGQTLTYALGPGAPVGATIDPATGVFAWTPTITDAPGTNIINVWVTDNGSPPLSDAWCFSVSVMVPRPDIESFIFAVTEAVLSWRSVSSKVYRVQCKTNLEDALWADLPGDVTASTNAATKNILIDSAVGQSFYRVQLLP